MALGPLHFNPLISIEIFGFFFFPYIYCYAIMKYKVTPGSTDFFSNDDGGILDKSINIFLCTIFGFGIIISIVLPILWIAKIN
jgi:hypothetical protein